MMRFTISRKRPARFKHRRWPPGMFSRKGTRMTRKRRRQYDEFASIIPWASLGRPSVVSQVGASLIPIGVYDPNLAVWGHERTPREVSSGHDDFEKYIINIVGTAIRSGTGKLVTCLHVVDEIIRKNLRSYALVLSMQSGNTIVHTSCAFDPTRAIKYVRPGQRKGNAEVDLSVVPFVPRDRNGNVIATPSVVWGTLQRWVSEIE